MEQENPEVFYCVLCKSKIALNEPFCLTNISLTEPFALIHPSCCRLRNKRNKLREELKRIDMKIFKKFVGV